MLTNSVLRNFGQCSANLFTKGAICQRVVSPAVCKNFSSESQLHVNSPYPPVEKVVGLTIQELIESNRGKW